MNRKKTKHNGFIQGGPKNVLVAIVAFLVLILLVSRLTHITRHIKRIPYSEFITQVERNKVNEIRISGHEVEGTFKDGSVFETAVGNNQADWDLFKKHNLVVSIADTTASSVSVWYLLPLLSLLVASLAAVWFFIRQSRSNSNSGGGGNIFSMGKSRARMFMPSTIKETFDSVAGATEAKEELKDIVEFLKSPEKYQRLGARVPRGVLLVGEPGNGKTLLAKAVAGEANCPFFSVSGSDFIEVFVGVGAARVRDLFERARQRAPSIIFIDEIDAVGRQRGSGMGGGHDEREQTLNQLLTEMDGFQTTGGSVIVIGATNRLDVLDKALLRPGRFDRQVEVPFPDLMSREEILRVHAKSVKIDPAVDLYKIARGTPGFTGADLANLINEAALNATKNHSQELVTMHDFEEARDKIMLGKESKTKILTLEERTVTAFHEAGHALVRLLDPENSDPLHKITIVPRGRALGVTHSLPERDRYTESKERMLTMIRSALGGRAAEQLKFNRLETGAYSDFVVATDIARKMVCMYGMSENLGPVVYSQQYGGYQYSPHTAERIDTEVENILNTCYKQTYEILEHNKEKLDLLGSTLLEKETMYASEIYELLGIQARQEFKFT